MKSLIVTVPEKPPFYSLYADGLYSWKMRSAELKATLLSYPQGAALALYYTYPAHREACLIRVSPRGSRLLPGLSRPVSLIFSVQASRTDKLRRALAFLNANAGGAFNFDDPFYTRLGFIIQTRGKLNYPALKRLASDARQTSP
jgi:hypothetical protein